MIEPAKGAIIQSEREKKGDKTMMKIYKVEQEILSFDWGRFEGYEEIGYFDSKEKAEAAKAEAEAKKSIVRGEVEITEITVQ